MVTTHEGPLLFSPYTGGDGIKAALGKKRNDIIAEIKEAKLCGRGGAGFPTGTKWMIAAAAKSDRKHVVCNADEGEPGTFKDRVLLDEFPDLVFDGMVICAYAIGASKGFVYLRGEYRYLLKKLEASLERMRAENRLGQNIQGKEGFNFDIEIRLGSGAYVCGEETALIESLEGQRGEPRNRPPFPVNTGYIGTPTVVNNVETFAAVAHIAAKGPDWFKAVGTDRSTGSKLFSVSGDCKYPGVYELPLGITVRELLQKVGAEDAKAVQVGGASGECFSADHFDRQIAYEDISTGGSIIIFGKSRDMLEVLRNFMEFFVEESCGQCTPCRIGNVRLLEAVEAIDEGTMSISRLREYKSLAESMKLASKCGLGQSSPKPFLSIIENFNDEILARV